MDHVPTKCSECEAFDQSVFVCLNSGQLSNLEKSTSGKIFKKGETIFYEGDEPEGLYCLHSGRVKLIRQGIHDHNILVRIAVAGEMLGYRAFFSQEPYTASAEVVEEASLCYIPRKIIEELMANNVTMASVLLRKVSKDLGSSEDRMHRLVDAPLKERMAELLIMLKDQYGTTEKVDGQILNFKLSRREMADFLGTTTESVIRTLSAFKKEGLILGEGRDILLLEVDQLQQMAGLDY